MMYRSFPLQLVFAALVFLLSACSPSATIDSNEALLQTTVPEPVVSFTPTTLPPTRKVTVTHTPQPMLTATASPSPEMALLPTTTPVLTLTEEAPTVPSHPFTTSIALQGWFGAPERLEIAVYDPLNKRMTTIMLPETIDGLSYGPPQWSSDKTKLMFAVFNPVENAGGFWVSDPTGTNLHQVGPKYPREINHDQVSGIAGFGWSFTNDWFAYANFYSPIDWRLFLLDMSSGNSIQTGVNMYWAVWSPYDNRLAYITIDNDALYIAAPESFDQPQRYGHEEYVGTMAWHPTENKILVGTGDNFVISSLNKLWSLDLDTGQWQLIGSFPYLSRMAYSPDGTLIAVDSQHAARKLSTLTIVDADSGENIAQIEKANTFFHRLDWLDVQTVAISTRDNILVFPVQQPESTYWVFDENSPIYAYYEHIQIADW
ncbi:MAG: hypothetical protein H6650_06310 [Ardenticatenales bacterium]|nr:hypothetical protein [Ardenticatenales bacterium]